MDIEQIRKLIEELHQKWQNKTITEDEVIELREWLAANDISHEEYFTNTSEKETEQKILSGIQKSVRRRGRVTNIKMIRWAAAAAVIIGLGMYLFFNRNDVQYQSPIVIKDVQPGQDKATLTLADGSIIQLDSTGNGTIKTEGNADIIKTADGISYHSKKSQQNNTMYNVMATPRGGQYKLTLSDGTMVWLNAASSIKYPAVFSTNNRTVEITGEVYFEVTKNAHEPFKVIAGNNAVEVLGTQFNINAYADEAEMKATLLDGKIKVINGAKQLMLKPGEQAKLFEENINVLHGVDVQQVIAWQKGLFQFRNADIAVIGRQISRWYDVEVEIEENAKKIRLGGAISKKVSLDKLLKVLARNGIKNNMQNGKLKLY
jgi:transmembrane sensor